MLVELSMVVLHTMSFILWSLPFFLLEDGSARTVMDPQDRFFGYRPVDDLRAV